MAEKVYVTSDGYKKLKDELKFLLDEKRPQLATKIKEAREMGDILENLPYDQAIEEQGLTEARIKEINDILNVAKIVDKSLSKDAVSIGTKVVLEMDGTTNSFTLVSSVEADPTKRWISIESPVGSALLGRKVGDLVEIKTPVFTAKYKIVEIK